MINTVTRNAVERSLDLLHGEPPKPVINLEARYDSDLSDQQLARIMGMAPWHLEVRNVKSEPFRDTRGPGKQGFRTLLQELGGRRTPKALRDRCALRLLYGLALRCGEVVSLDVEDVDIAQATLAVRGKGGTSKQILSVPEATQRGSPGMAGRQGPGTRCTVHEL